MVVNARSSRAAMENERMSGLSEIDKKVDREAKRKLSMEDKRRLRKVQRLARWTAEDIKDKVDEEKTRNVQIM